MLKPETQTGLVYLMAMRPVYECIAAEEGPTSIAAFLVKMQPVFAAAYRGELTIDQAGLLVAEAFYLRGV